MKKHLASTFTLMAILLVACCAANAKTKVEEITAEQFLKLVGSKPAPQVIDTRSVEQRATAYITASKNIQVNSLDSQIERFDLKRPIILCCQTGQVQAAAIQIITVFGPSSIVTVKNGMAGFFQFLEKEKSIIKANPARKKDFDKLRSILVTTQPVVGLKFPAVTLYGSKSKRTATTSLRGKPYMLVFFEASNPSQLSTVMKMKQRFSKLSKMQFIPMAVYSRPDEKSKLEKSLASKKWKGPMYFDRDRSLYSRMALYGFPNYNIVDATGILRVNDITETSGKIDAFGNETLEQLASQVHSGVLPPYPLNGDSLIAYRQNLLQGAVPPDFKLQDTSGKQFKLSSLRGKKNVVLVFGLTNCPYSKKEFELMNECYRQVDKFEFAFFGILPADDKSYVGAAKEYAKDLNLNFPLLIDEGHRAFKNYSISRVPVLWLIDRDGMVRFHRAGLDEQACLRLSEYLK